MNLKANLLIFSLLLIPGLKLFAQDELNQPNLRFYLSEDKSSYAGAVFVNQIWTRNIWNNPDALNEASVQYDAGINWLMHGHNLKWTLQYSSRPIYTMVADQYQWTETKGQIILQTQIYF